MCVPGFSSIVVWWTFTAFALGVGWVQPWLNAQDAAQMTSRVDALLGEKLRHIGWEASGPCSEAAFLRRAHLDLTGSPPTASEVLDFLQNESMNKVDMLVDRLLKSPACANHLGNTWASWMLPEENDPQLQGGRNGLQVWLRNRFAENLRYDRLVSDLLIASGSAQSGPTAFFVSLEGKPEKIAAKTARVFLGVQLDCAECHDHPFDKWKQRDFWGFAAYFAQLSTDSERPIQGNGTINDISEGEVKLPGTEEVVPPKPLVKTGYSGLEAGTRRQQLTLWLTARENPFLARATVNRVWALLFGRGLIEPVDDMRSLDMASHPELLSELSEYFAATGYDLRNLVAMLAKTQAYRRSTRNLSGEPPVDSFAVMASKPLTETQLTASLSQVARQISGAGDAQAQVLASQLGRLRGDASEAKLGIVSALVALHGKAFDDFSREGSSRLLKALEAPHLDQRKQVRWMFLSTLNRLPSSDEERAFSEHLGRDELLPLTTQESSGAEDQQSTHWQSDLLWALINSTEFAMTP